ncbi:MAG: hypothetical protein SGI73_05595 [Chloroflexota bacterium]|nr:hypothetical protein [Chloroflexota bacterium]
MKRILCSPPPNVHVIVSPRWTWIVEGMKESSRMFALSAQSGVQRVCLGRCAIGLGARAL